MAFKIGSAADLDRFPITDQAVITALRDYLTIFDNVYGSDRNIEEKGGYALYLSKDDSLQELTKWYNTDDIIEPEFVDEIIGAEVPYCIAVYISNRDCLVVICPVKSSCCDGCSLVAILKSAITCIIANQDNFLYFVVRLNRHLVECIHAYGLISIIGIPVVFGHIVTAVLLKGKCYTIICLTAGINVTGRHFAVEIHHAYGEVLGVSGVTTFLVTFALTLTRSVSVNILTVAL